MAAVKSSSSTKKSTKAPAKKVSPKAPVAKKVYKIKSTSTPAKFSRKPEPKRINASVILARLVLASGSIAMIAYCLANPVPGV